MSSTSNDTLPQRGRKLPWLLIFLGVLLAVIVGTFVFSSKDPLQQAVEDAGGIYSEYRVSLDSNRPLWQVIPEYVVDTLTPAEQRHLALYFSGTDLDDEWLRQHVDQFSQRPLHSLNLSGTQITDDGLQLLQQCASIADLDLSRTNMTDDSIVTILALKNLHAVNLSETNVTSQGLMRLTTHSQIRRVAVTAALLTDEVVAQFNQTPQIVELTLHDATKSDLERASQLQHVTSLTLQAVPEDELPSLNQFSNLLRLTLLDNEIPLQSLAKLQEQNPQLSIDHWTISEERARELGVYEDMERQARARRIFVATVLLFLIAVPVGIFLVWRRHRARKKRQLDLSTAGGSL